MNIVEIAVRGGLTLKTGDKRYVLEFPVRAIMVAEESIGRSLKSPADWFCAPAKDVPALVKAGMLKHHADVPESEIDALLDEFNPEMYVSLTEALGALAFPDWFAKFKENLDKGKGGTVSPNAESADARP